MLHSHGCDSNSHKGFMWVIYTGIWELPCTGGYPYLQTSIRAFFFFFFFFPELLRWKRRSMLTFRHREVKILGWIWSSLQGMEVLQTVLAAFHTSCSTSWCSGLLVLHINDLLFCASEYVFQWEKVQDKKKRCCVYIFTSILFQVMA